MNQHWDRSFTRLKTLFYSYRLPYPIAVTMLGLPPAPSPGFKLRSHHATDTAQKREVWLVQVLATRQKGDIHGRGEGSVGEERDWGEETRCGGAGA